MSIDFANINEYKSDIGVAKLFGEAIQRKVLKPDEELSEKPESLIAILISNIADIASNSFFEQRMYLNEVNPSTAILHETLMANLLDTEIPKIFATPATGYFFLAFPKKALLENAIIEESTSGAVKRIRINKEAKFAFLTSQVFTLDHSIDIYITNFNTDKPVFKANFDLSDKYSDSLSAISNSVLNVRPLSYQGVQYIAIDVPARNIERIYYNNIINSTEVADEQYAFTNQLMGFEVLYKENATANWRKLTGYPNGRENYDGYYYDIFNDGTDNYVKIMFGSHENAFKPAIRSELQVIIYTTTGAAGNIKIPNISENTDNLQFYLQQDSANIYESAMGGIIVLCSVSSTETTGGKNQMSFEEIRKYVQNRGNANKILSLADLNRKVEDYKGCSIEKIRHDFELDIRVNTTLKEEGGNDIIASGYGNIYFDFNDIKDRIEIKAKIIKPTDVFRLDGSDKTYRFQKTPISYKKYAEAYGNNTITEVSFPFFIKWTNTNSINAYVYDLAANDVYNLSTKFYDAIALDNVTVTNMKVYRNPSNEFPTQLEQERDVEGYYFIDFFATVGDSLLSLLIDERKRKENGEDIEPSVNFRLVFYNKKIKQTFFADGELQSINEENKTVHIKTILKTNNNIKEDSSICFTDYSIIPVPIPAVPTRYYYLDDLVDFELIVMFKSKEMSKNRDVNYDKFLSSDELTAGYYVGIIYEANDIKFGTDLTDSFNFNTDVKLKDLEYQRYDADVYKTYLENEYEYDEDGNIVIKDVTITLADGTEYTSKIMSLIHSKGEYVKDNYGNKVILYRKGDIIRDSRGKPIPKTNYADMTGIIRNFPWYDRIYNVNTKYFDIRNAYYRNIGILEELQSIVLNGIILSLGFKKTSGKSSLFYIKNLFTREDEPLDNIAISLDFGVRFDDKLTESDKLFNINTIIEKTREYIYNEVTNEFNINNLFSYLKDIIPSIIHLEHYKINNYDSSVTQTIIKKTTNDLAENEILGIRSNIDIEKSDLDQNEVYFKPDIVVKLI